VLLLVIVGAKLGLTPERARQFEAQGLEELRDRSMRDGSAGISRLHKPGNRTQ
jgi:DNA-directed RNA polymerase sigma subunit (sigma70/sigma32)